MVVAQPKQYKVRHGVFALLLIGDPPLQVLHEDIHANLVGHREFKVRRFRGKVTHEFRLGSDVGSDQRNSPRPFVDTTTPLRRERLPGATALCVQSRPCISGPI
jgi:hypothetical protein